MAFKLPSIPINQKTDQNVKLAIDTLSGRMNINGRAILFQDLIDMGVVQFKEGISLANITGGVDPGDVLEPSELPANPTTPQSLSTAGSWGAIFLTWAYAAYQGEYGTEIWRSQINDRNTAVLIAVATGRAYTDNVGAKETYYYWVRNRNTAGVVGGYNQLSGVQGDSNLTTTAQDFVMAHPEAQHVPFTIANFGTELDPQWKLLLNGETIITSNLAIGQLITGEMNPNTTFTVGNASLEIGTDSEGLGFINVAGDGGISGNDYLRITQGAIKSYVYSGGTHVNYKELRRIERGIANSGVQVVIPAYFKAEPTVYLSPHNITVYNPTYSAQAQTLILDEGNVSPHPTIAGSWVFTPIASLALSSGIDSQIETINTTTYNDTPYIVNSAHIFINALGATVKAKAASNRLIDAATYQNRQVTFTVEARRSDDSTAWAVVSTETKDIFELTDTSFTATFSFAYQSDWKLRYTFTPADRTGTFPSGGALYDYANDNSTTGDLFTIATTVANTSLSDEVINTRPARDASWELFEIDYSFTFNAIAEAWVICYDDCIDFPREDQGYAVVSVPGQTAQEAYGNTLQDPSNGICNDFPSISHATYRKTELLGGTGGTGGKIAITPNDPLYLAGKYTASLCTANGEKRTSQFLFCDVGNARASLEILSYNVTYYYRKAKAFTTDPTNHYEVNSVDADLGAIDVSVGVAVINWLAVGE